MTPRKPAGQVRALHPLNNPQERFGRIAAIDFRDRNHLVSRWQAALAVHDRFRYYRAPLVIDQGSTSECVAYSNERLLAAGPVVQAETLYASTAGRNSLYKECQRNDEWPGEDYNGTSVRAAMKVLQAAGFIKEYLWATSAAEALAYLLTSGPVVFGTDWYYSMDTTRKYSGKHWVNLRTDSGIAGGHAYLILGGSRIMRCPHGQNGSIQVQNSWGKSWGDNGRAFMCLHDADMLIKASGEAAMSLEIRVPQVRAKNGAPTPEVIEESEPQQAQQAA